ncbi:Transcriptional regulator [Coemansia sp. RSA 2611]|nr:Transcriptional regulator [Coemansia sp. RSA 2610]KAJ2388568.1 Transcriptional regulator [Coemansia sp. RSA 2611]
MSSFLQFSVDEVQQSSLISQFAAAHDLSVKRSLSSSELRQLQTELGRISTRAASRAAKLEQCQTRIAGYASGASNKRSNDEWMPDQQQETTVSTPSTDHPAGKRVKLNQSTSRVGGSDSESSTKTGSVRGINGQSGVGGGSSSRLNGDGEFSQQSSADPLAGAATPKAKHSAGTPVQDDFSRVKVTNQVQIQTYWTSLEPYFRNITDEDIAFLESTNEDQELYVIPKLGKFYAYAWAEEEVTHFPDHMHSSKTRYLAKSLLGSDTSSKSRPSHSALAGNSVGSDMALNTSRLAPLTERIVSALVAERLVLNGGSRIKTENGDSAPNGGNLDYRSDTEDGTTEIEPYQLSSNGETLSLEDRLKRELRYIGIIDDDDVDWDGREDDEVCVTIRALQRQLREQTKVNKLRKARLLPISKEHIGFQEYTQVIDELDKQVEQCYIKRHRQTKSRKRKSAPVKTISLSDNALNAMDRRQRVIQAIGHLFPPEKFALPSESIFTGIPQNPDVQMK